MPLPPAMLVLAALSPTAPHAGGSTLNTVWELTLKGGPVMIPIAICSLVAMALAIERLIVLRRRAVVPEGLLAALTAALHSGPSSTIGNATAKALELCRSQPSPIARIAEAALRRWDRPLEQVEKHVAEAGAREAALLRRNLRGLAVIASVAPLLGLLGTIFGMITAFRTVAASAEALGRTELLAGGIYEAMVTTAAGLVVAIPTLLVYHALSARIDRLVLEMDAACIELVEQHEIEAAPRLARSAA